MGIGKKRALQKKKKRMIKGLYMYVFAELVNKSARRILGLWLNIVWDWDG